MWQKPLPLGPQWLNQLLEKLEYLAVYGRDTMDKSWLCNRYPTLLRPRACQCDQQRKYDSLMSLLDALSPSSYACHTGLATGGGGVLPRSRYRTPGPISMQPRDAVTRN